MNGTLSFWFFLIEHGATKDFQDRCGCTPLMIASNYSHVEIVNLLVEQGANLDVQDNNGNTALHYAILGNSSVAVLSILSFGACQLYYSNRLTPNLFKSASYIISDRLPVTDQYFNILKFC